MVFMSLLSRLLRPGSLVTGGAAGLIFILVWVGPQFGIRGPWLALGVLAVLFLWLIIMFLLRLRAQRAGAALEKSLEDQAQSQLVSSRPGREEEIDHLRTQLLEAVQALKASRVGKSKGGAGALYVLPWYMIIGPPASGKTTVLANSGLNFPYLDPGRNRPSVRGVGGTRNCDWWFADEAVILDTAGRYVLPVEADDTQEWLAFLDLLRKYRGKKPINGLIVGVSIQDLVMGGEEDVESHALKIRSRVDELIQRLGISFPIYVVFTKCDLIRGFVEFFGDLSKTERAAVWGATIARERFAREPAEGIFRAEMEQLTGALRQARVPRTAEAANPESRPEILFFPLQFHALTERLASFVEILFRENPYHERPIFRGFYFTSGTQEGRPIDQVINAMLRGFGIAAAEEGMTVAPSQTKSYFIENAFSKVVFPDRYVAGPSAEGERKRRSRRAKVFAAGCVGLALLTAALVVLSASNRRMLHQVQSLSDRAAASAQRGSLDFTVDDLHTLESLRSKLETMDDRSRPVTKVVLLGTYQGEKAAEAARRLYLASLHDAVMAPVQPYLARNLAQHADSLGVTFPRYYGWYRTWRILQDPAARLGPADAEPVAAQLSSYWAPVTGVPDGKDREDFDKLFVKQIAYAARYPEILADLFPPAPYRDEHVENVARRAIQRYWSADGVYSGVGEAGAAVPSITVGDILGADVGVYGDVAVPGAYTQAGWQGPVTGYMDWLETVRGDWVLRECWNGTPPGIREAVLARYGRDYGAHWQDFMAAIRVEPGTDPEATRSFLERAAGESGPVLKVLRAVDQNTRFDQESDPGLTAVETEFGALHEFFRAPGGGGPFKFLHGGDSGGQAPYLDYIDKVKALANGYAAVAAGGDPAQSEPVLGLVSWVDTRIPNTETSPASQEMARVLKLPARLVTGSVGAEAGRDVQSNWSRVLRDYQSTLAGRFPLASGGADCSLADFEQFFGPNGTFWTFYQESLSGLVSEDGHELPNPRVHLSPAFLDCLRTAYRIRRGMFPDGGKKAGFGFSIQPDQVQRESSIVMRGVRLDLGGQSLIYQMGQRTWTPMTWPGPNPENGADLRLDAGDTAVIPSLSFSGAWGFFHLLDQGRIHAGGSNQVALAWTLNAQPSPVTVTMNVSGLSSIHPLSNGFFRFSLPSQIVAARR